MKEIIAGPTRKKKRIDRTFTNFSKKVLDKGVIAELAPKDGAKGSASDHKVVYFRAALEFREKTTWTTYTTRRYNEKKAEEFGAWLATVDWGELQAASGSNKKAEIYHKLMDGAMEKYFPTSRIRRKTNEPPWIGEGIRKEREKNKAIFRKEGRTKRWRELNDKTNEKEDLRRKKYKDEQKAALTSDESGKKFHALVKNYKSAERAEPFDMKELYPGLGSKETAEELATFFNRISQEFEPLEPCDIPLTYNRDLPVLEPYQVSGRIRSFKSPIPW